MQDHNIESRVKELVGDGKLEAALELLISQSQSQTQRRNNALLVLKGRLAMLEEQELGGLMAFEELERKKVVIAHQILDIADGSALDEAAPQQPQPQSVGGKTWVRYLLMGGVLAGLALAFFLWKKNSPEIPGQPGQLPQTEERSKAENPDEEPEITPPDPASDGKLEVVDFPNYRKKFNFLDFQFDFRDVEAEWVSDTEIRLTIWYYLACKSNLGVCYRATVRIIADGNPIAPAHQSNLDGWIAHKATAKDDLTFVLPAGTKEYHIELSRDGSNWKRGFKILQ